MSELGSESHVHHDTNSNRNKFQSKWDYIKSFTRYHFNPQQSDDDCFKVFLKIKGDWKKELEELKFEIPVGLDNYVYKGEKGDGLIEKDFRDWGYKEDMIQYLRTYQIPEKFKQIASQLKLNHPDIRIHRQSPGMVAPIHADAFCSHPQIHNDPTLNVKDMRRFIIMLTDWDWGHMFQFGTSHWSRWEAGDVVSFNSRDNIHCTANAGKSHRDTMIVTGWLSEETKALIEKGPITVEI